MKLNPREQLEATEHWLAWQDESLSYGLRSAEDGIKLWRWSMQHPDLPEFLDTPDCAKYRKIALGYDPLSPKERARVEKEY